jgi:lipopolysaccharide transport system permease protein
VTSTESRRRSPSARGRHPSDLGTQRGPAITLIEPRHRGTVERARELWRSRRLVAYFGKRFVQKSYLRTRLGWIWLPLRPALDVGARVLVFGGLLGAPSEGKPYLIFFLVGMAAWHMFASAIMWATRSLELNRRVLTRIYVPRLAALFSAAVPSLVGYLMYLAITVIATGYYLFTDGTFYLQIGLGTLQWPLGIALLLALALGVGLWTSIWGTQGRDTRFTIGYFTSFAFFLTPVIYPLSAVPESYRIFAELNPLTAPVELVRRGLLGAEPLPAAALAVSLGTTAVLWIAGLRHFGREEAAAVDNL